MPRTLLFLTLLAVGCNRSPSSAIVEVGHVPGANSEESQRGIDLAIEEWNADPARAFAGRRLVVRHAAPGSKPDQWAAQASRLVALNRVKGLMGPAGAEGVVTISIAGAPISTDPNLFAIGVAPDERGRVLALWANQQLSGRPGPIVVVRDAGENAVADRFARDCRSFANVTETRTFAKDLEAAIVLLATSAERALELMPTLGGRTVLFGGEVTELLADARRAENLIVVAPCDLADQSNAFQSFARRYRDRFGESPNISAVMSHDALLVWAEAARRAGEFELPAVRAALLERDATFEGVAGPIWFAPDRTARRKLRVSRVRAGKLEAVAAFDPTAR